MENSYEYSKKKNNAKSGYTCCMCGSNINIHDAENTMRSCSCYNTYCKTCANLLEKLNDFYMHKLHCPCFYFKPYFYDEDKLKCRELRNINIEKVKEAIIQNKHKKTCNIICDDYSSEEEDRWDMCKYDFKYKKSHTV